METWRVRVMGVMEVMGRPWGSEPKANGDVPGLLKSSVSVMVKPGGRSQKGVELQRESGLVR
jgi:hypothetical protein